MGNSIRTFVQLKKHTSIIEVLLSIFIVISSYPITVNAQQDCVYLEQYLAPIKTPIDNWPETIAGPAPGDVEQRLVGPEECKVVAEKLIHNAN